MGNHRLALLEGARRGQLRRLDAGGAGERISSTHLFAEGRLFLKSASNTLCRLIDFHIHRASLSHAQSHTNHAW